MINEKQNLSVDFVNALKAMHEAKGIAGVDSVIYNNARKRYNDLKNKLNKK